MGNALPLVIAHRGGCSHAPENTLEAIEIAFRVYRADMVEIDIRFTKDQIPVLFHDARVHRTTDGHGYVSDYTLHELRSLDAAYHFDPDSTQAYPKRGQGIRVPTLEETLHQFPGRSFAIEIKEKSVPALHRVMELLENHEAEKRSIVGSKHDIVTRELAGNYPHLRHFCSQKEVLKLYLNFMLGRHTAVEDPFAVASIPVQSIGFRLDGQGWIDFLHQKKIKVFFWSIPNHEMIRPLWEKGADGLVVKNLEAANKHLGR